MRIVVSGIPRGYHVPHPDGNWLQPSHREQIIALSPDIELLEVPAQRLAETDLGPIEVALAEGGNRTHYPGELDWADYQRLFVPGLRWVQLCSTGFSDNLTPAVLAGVVTLTNAPGLHTIPLAESVLAAMLAHAKRLDARRADQDRRLWRQLQCDELAGRTVLIIGLGRIGARVARLCRGFDMKVVGARRRPEAMADVETVFGPAELPRYLPEADYVVLAAPLTPQTDGLLDEAALGLLKPTAYLINVGRGRVVVEKALLDALSCGRIAGAYLDAFAEEPLPAEHPFWALDNVRIVPHDSHSSPYIGDRMVELFCDNLRRYLTGQPLHNICDPARGY